MLPPLDPNGIDQSWGGGEVVGEEEVEDGRRGGKVRRGAALSCPIQIGSGEETREREGEISGGSGERAGGNDGVSVEWIRGVGGAGWAGRPLGQLGQGPVRGGGQLFFLFFSFFFFCFCFFFFSFFLFFCKIF